VTYDSNRDNAFAVHQHEKTILFNESNTGLYFHDIHARAIVLTNAVIEIVAANRKRFTQRQYKEARHTIELEGMVGFPSDYDYKGMVRENLLKNCPVTISHINNAKTIFGPAVPSLKGKTVRQSP